MGFNLVNNIENCHTLISQAPLNLVYYSHIPTAIVALIIALFVFIKSKNSLISRVLVAIAVTFSLWSFLDLVTWTSTDSRRTMIAWALLGILDVLIFILCLYFVYVFINKKDISLGKKIIFFIPFLPVILLTPSNLNLTGFEISSCESIEGKIFTNYYYFLSLAISFLILLVLANGYRKSDKEFKKQILLMAAGVELFLFSFFTTGFLSSYLDNFNLLFYGLFSMVIFIGFLAYLIVKFKAFNVKLIGAQALVYSLIILIGSQFFFIQNNTNRILTGITLALAIGFGIFLIRSVKNEVKRKEELQGMTEQLAVANDQLRKLDNAKSEFISIASHQLRTPLTSIKGYASLLLEGTYGKIDREVMDTINKIYTSNERLIQLVEDLLNVSRIESGRMEFQFEKHKIEDIIKELYDTFALIAKDKKLFINLNLPDEPLPEIEIDPAKIREVISNLIDNALKYSKKGGVTIKAELLAEGFVRVSVSDTGIGIPEGEIPYLFTKFSRGKDTSRLSVTGTGLGLYVGKSIVEAQHGRILVESAGAGKGAKFSIDLPIEQPK
jgi:signal transduction histidine kinase